MSCGFQYIAVSNPGPGCQTEPKKMKFTIWIKSLFNSVKDRELKIREILQYKVPAIHETN